MEAQATEFKSSTIEGTRESVLVIENVSRLATAGMVGVCAICISDYDRQLATAAIR